jgi:hypothetical protein
MLSIAILSLSIAAAVSAQDTPTLRATPGPDGTSAGIDVGAY